MSCMTKSNILLHYELFVIEAKMFQKSIHRLVQANSGNTVVADFE
jgi:hypothetical protein